MIKPERLKGSGKTLEAIGRDVGRALESCAHQLMQHPSAINLMQTIHLHYSPECWPYVATLRKDAGGIEWFFRVEPGRHPYSLSMRVVYGGKTMAECIVGDPTPEDIEEEHV